MPMIDPTARIEPGAIVEDDVSIGPYCIIGPKVVIGTGCRLVAHVHIAGQTAIGARTVIHPFASLGSVPQSTNYRGEATRLVVGTDCDIREGVTMSIGTDAGRRITEVGDRGFFMAYSHVAHDCRVGNDVIFANCATLGGHCVVGDHVFIGGLSAVHQFTRIGAHAMIGGMSGVRGDVIPFGLAAGGFAGLSGVNIVGMRRRKFPPETIRTVRSAYKTLFFAEGTLDARLAATEAQFGHDPAAAQMIAFVREKRERPLCFPDRHIQSDAG
jgi:UDP-N-acetylglucosamine acyltransferase